MTLEATQWQHGAVFVLVLKGRIEAADVEDFEKPIQDRIQAGDLNIIIDFQEVETIDLVGIRSLLRIAARVVVRHGKIVICGLGDNLAALFSVAAIDKVVKIFDSYEEAINDFR